MNKYTQWAILGFVIFLVLSSPTESGTTGRDMVSWIASGGDNVRDFLDSLFSREETNG